MSVIGLLLFCSLLLVAGSLVLFVVSARQGDCHESDRMCLLPLEDDERVRESTSPVSRTVDQMPNEAEKVE